MKAEDVEGMIDDMAEIEDELDAVYDAYKTNDDLDVDELLNELDDYEADEDVEVNQLDMPDVPTGKVLGKKNQKKSAHEDKELENLAQLIEELSLSL